MVVSEPSLVETVVVLAEVTSLTTQQILSNMDLLSENVKIVISTNPVSMRVKNQTVRVTHKIKTPQYAQGSARLVDHIMLTMIHSSQWVIHKIVEPVATSRTTMALKSCGNTTKSARINSPAVVESKEKLMRIQNNQNHQTMVVIR